MGEYYNTIILRHAEGSYTKKQFKNYSEGDCIYGPNTDPEELKDGRMISSMKQKQNWQNINAHMTSILIALM